MDGRTEDGRWVSTALAILCPVSAITVAGLGESWALAGLLWTLGVACPLAWLHGERRLARREAAILASHGGSEERRADEERV